MSQPEDVQQSQLARGAGWIKKQFRKERKEQFDREVQLTMVWMGHVTIVIGVAVILGLLFGGESVGSTIYVFWGIECAIIVFSFVVANTSSKPIVDALKGWVMGVDKLEKWMERHGDAVRGRVQRAMLLLVYTLQLGSMVALLLATGGPIDSPFAPMALAIAVFTPFIVNKWWTVGLIIVSTMIFYSVFVGIAGFDKELAAAVEEGERRPGFNLTRPEPGAYIAVNLFILLLASLMTWKRREKVVFTLRRTFDAPREKVWSAWTERDEVARWFGSGAPYGSLVKMDVRPDGEWMAALVRRNGTPGFPWAGVYREVDPPKRLVFTITGRAGRGEEVVEVELEERNGKTSMAVKLRDDGRHLGLKEGWSSFFDHMERSLVDDPYN